MECKICGKKITFLINGNCDLCTALLVDLPELEKAVEDAVNKEPTKTILQEKVAVLVADLEAGSQLFCDQPSVEKIRLSIGEISFKSRDTDCGGCRKSWGTIRKYFGDWKDFQRLPPIVSKGKGREEILDIKYLKAFAKGNLDKILAEERLQNLKDGIIKYLRESLVEKQLKNEQTAKTVDMIRNAIPALSTEQLQIATKLLFENNLQPAEGEFFVSDEMLIVVKTDWDTETTKKGGYCSESGKVTDYAVRKTYVFNFNLGALAVGKEKKLFRTTDDGVVGKHYGTRVVAVEKGLGILVVKYEDGEVKISL